MRREPYPSDLTDAQWALVAPLLPPPARRGRKRSVDPREVLNALFYLDRTGCQWRALPHEFPRWQTVYTCYRRWRLAGVWTRLHDRLRDQVRLHVGRDVSPRAAIIDSQSVKTTEKGGHAATTRARKSADASATSS
jgi:putative transposase